MDSNKELQFIKSYYADKFYYNGFPIKRVEYIDGTFWWEEDSNHQTRSQKEYDDIEKIYKQELRLKKLKRII